MIVDSYVFIVMIGLWAMYFFLTFSLAIFFEWERPQCTLRKTARSLGFVALGAVLVFIAMELVESREVANRIEHAFGGGFLAFLLCYRVAHDIGRPITRFQFFVLSFLTVNALGVANEILEFFAQNYFGWVVAKSLNDTWLDLISNIVGALIGASVFVPLLKTKRSE